VAGTSKVYVIRDGTYPTTLDVDSPMSPVVEFVQAHDKVILFQSAPLAKQLVWDGLSSDGFKGITKKDPADTSTVLIPPAVTAEHAGDRLLIIDGNNELLATDIADYTSVDRILEKFYVNSNTSDVIVRAFQYANGIVIVFKSRSINALLNWTGDPALAQVQLVNSHLGLAGRKAVVQVGGDLLFLSAPGGIYRVAQTFESRLETVPLPITDPIQPLIDRINWGAASVAVAVLVGEYVKFFVPIDGATRNNCAIVINAATNLIEGYDTWPDAFRVDDVAVTLYQGEHRLFVVDKANARIYVMDEGKSDFIFDRDTETTTEYEIADLMETRGYAELGWNAATKKDFQRVEIKVDTWAPSLQVTALLDNANDERPLHQTPITRNRLLYDNFGRKNYDPTNVHDDWARAGRQDYSIVADDIGFDPGSGVDPDRKQTSTLRFSTKSRGGHVSYRIANSQGQADVSAVLVESEGLQREPRRAG
jgi:hypothetical protein